MFSLPSVSDDLEAVRNGPWTPRGLIYSWNLGSLYDIVGNVPDCDIVESGFELQSRYYVRLRTNIHGKGMNPLILPALS